MVVELQRVRQRMGTDQEDDLSKGGKAAMIWTNDAVQLLLRELEPVGLMKAELLDERRLLLRTQANLPRVRIQGTESTVEWADVMVTVEGTHFSFRIEHPDASEVMHPNWDADGYWRASKAAQYEFTDNDSLIALLRYMIGGLKMKPNCFTLDEPVNRNAVSWCYRHGKVPIKVVSTRTGDQKQPATPAADRPRASMTISKISISPRRFEE